MTVVVSTSSGWIIDDCGYWQERYGETGPSTTQLSKLYAINDVFRMQSQRRDAPMRKRRRHEVSAEVEKECSTVNRLYKTVRTACEWPERSGTNDTALAMARRIESAYKLYSTEEGNTVDSALVDNCALSTLRQNTLYTNVADMSINLAVGDDVFRIPPRCAFSVGDVRNGVSQLVDLGLKFDLVVVDPPWHNKAVTRKRNYHTDNCEWLCDVALHRLLHENSIVCLWTTNNARVIEFVRERLMGKWQLKCAAEIYWLKVTASGEPVYSLEEKLHHGKRPYERLVLSHTENMSTELRQKLRLCDGELLVSVPCAVSSTKPQLYEWIRHVGGENVKLDNQLELFARRLCADTTSIGDQVLLFQHVLE